MKFAFTEDQLAFRDAVVELFEQHSNAAQLRAAWSNDTGRTADAWKHLHDMGVLDAMRAEADGGLGLSEIDVVLIAEASGKFALAEPLIETMMVAAPLGLVASGESAAVACHETPLAVWADSCATVIELTSNGVVSAPREALTLSAHTSVDGARRLFHVGSIVAAPGVATNPDMSATALAFRRAALGTGAQLLGLADRMIDMTVEYAKERKQFGVPIGSFQAMKHHLANARVKLEFARPLVYRAAASLRDNDPEAGRHVNMAKAAANDAAAIAGKVALQCHGAIGYTTEYDLHLYLKRSWALNATWGDAAWHRAQLRTALFASSHHKEPIA